MKKRITISGIALLSALLIVPVVVWAHGWGMGGGGHMMGWGRGPGYGANAPYDDAYGRLTDEQQDKLADLDRKFYNDTRELRDTLWSKSDELNGLLSENNPDPGKVTKLQREISDLRARLDEKAVSHEIEARKILPQTRSGRGYGYGPHMRGGYGMGPGMGYGSGPCWNN
jgi:Spy/CpxP family protein refolding chaperone